MAVVFIGCWLLVSMMVRFLLVVGCCWMLRWLFVGGLKFEGGGSYGGQT